MNFIDLTHLINNKTPEFPGDSKTSLKQIKNIDYNLFELKTSLHTGTHIDAPFHYMDNGLKVNDIDINDFISKCSVVNIDTAVKRFEDFVIIKTNHSKYWGSNKYFYDYPYLTLEFSEKLIEENVKGVAIDTCSVDKIGESKIHKKLLENNIWIVENLANTDKLKENKYMGFFIPMKIEAEASPVRAFVKKGI